MENFEKIDDYILGRLNGEEKKSFDQMMEGDPSLRSEVKLQEQLVDEIKKARFSELKSMLNQVPVTGSMVAGSGFTASQIAIGVVTTAVVVSSTLLYFKPWKSNDVVPELQVIKPTQQRNIIATDSVENKDKVTPVVVEKTSSESKLRNGRKIVAQNPTTKTVVIPKIEVINPTEDLSETSNNPEKISAEKKGTEVTNSKIEVETNNTLSKYSFHYQFNSGKLVLYGAFDKDLYEIIEVNGSTHSVFLFYKDNYYLLNERITSITPLTPITDGSLIKKLNEFRKG